ncbi:PEP-CTERM sorting domain-containing protein [Sphingobium sp. H33]|uniref:PEP-CTERM sorting domain-containing protein n=2 Tax=Sphingobium nicotianae TaxID=2782607 RepID=A0A9X1DFJ5_9SPHN|nr:PEP-CTERM sorting domain-containing protein [Sphingobium nicotianae]
MILCPRTTSNYCGGDFAVSFASVVNSLTFLFTGDDSVQSLSVEAFLGAATLGTLTVFGDGVTGTAQLVNLAAFGDLDRIVVTGASKDPAGYGYDDFTFQLAGTIPEPSSWALMIGGFGLVGMAMRRRSARVAFS